MPITMSRADAHLGSALDLRIDPLRVTTYATGKLPGVRRARARLERLPFPVPPGLERRLLAVIARRHPFVLDRDRDPVHWPVAQDPKYLRLIDLLDHLDDPESTSWFTDALERIERGGSLRMKDGPVTDEAGLRRHLESYLLPLVAAFARDGYRADLDDEPGRVLIGPDGALHKTNKGAHRFLLARRFGGDPLRVRVTCVHADWWATATRGGSDAARLDSAVDALRGVAETHRSERRRPPAGSD